MTKDKDPIIVILKKLHNESDKKVPFILLSKCYEIEKSYIFEKDRTKPMNLIKQIIEDYIDGQTE